MCQRVAQAKNAVDIIQLTHAIDFLWKRPTPSVSSFHLRRLFCLRPLQIPLQHAVLRPEGDLVGGAVGLVGKGKRNNLFVAHTSSIKKPAPEGLDELIN